jgi:glutathione S-transferase
MRMIELWHEWNSVQSFKVRVVLAEKTLAWTEHLIELLKFEHLQPHYLALNPNGVVPTLAHDGRVVLESSVICQYLDDTFPEPALMPRDPYAHAQARIWLKTFDDVVHAALRQASFELLYRPLLAKMSPAELEERIARHPNPARAQRFRDAARGTANAAAIQEAVASFRGIMRRMDAVLSENEWLAGARYSLADVGMSPFVERLDHLGMRDLWEAFPHAKRWRVAMMARPAIAGASAPPKYRLLLYSPARLNERGSGESAGN